MTFVQLFHIHIRTYFECSPHLVINVESSVFFHIFSRRPFKDRKLIEFEDLLTSHTAWSCCEVLFFVLFIIFSYLYCFSQQVMFTIFTFYGLH